MIVGFAAVCIEWRRAEANYRDATMQRALAQQNLAGEQAANDKLRQANAQDARPMQSCGRRFARDGYAAIRQGRGDLALDAIKRFYAGASQRRTAQGAAPRVVAEATTEFGDGVLSKAPVGS